MAQKENKIIKIQNHGFLEEAIQPDEYIFGAHQVPEEVIRPDGQWDTFLPVEEPQRRKIETMNCVTYGTLNGIEILEKAKYGVENNWSERYVGTITGTTRNGNSAQRVCEAVRKTCGCIPEAELPFTDEIKTWAQYYSPRPMTKKYTDMGKKWLETYEFMHEWVFTSSTARYLKARYLKKALQYSPVGVSVLAWKSRNGKYYKYARERDNHWCVCYGYVDKDHWKVFDTYTNMRKKLEWNYNFRFGKRFHLLRRTPMNKIYRLKDKNEIVVKLGEGYYWLENMKDWNNLAAELPWLKWENVQVVDKFDFEYSGRTVGKSNFSELAKKLVNAPAMKGIVEPEEIKK